MKARYERKYTMYQKVKHHKKPRPTKEQLRRRNRNKIARRSRGRSRRAA